MGRRNRKKNVWSLIFLNLCFLQPVLQSAERAPCLGISATGQLVSLSWSSISPWVKTHQPSAEVRGETPADFKGNPAGRLVHVLSCVRCACPTEQCPGGWTWTCAKAAGQSSWDEDSGARPPSLPGGSFADTTCREVNVFPLLQLWLCLWKLLRQIPTVCKHAASLPRIDVLP